MAGMRLRRVAQTPVAKVNSGARVFVFFPAKNAKDSSLVSRTLLIELVHVHASFHARLFPGPIDHDHVLIVVRHVHGVRPRATGTVTGREHGARSWAEEEEGGGGRRGRV